MPSLKLGKEDSCTIGPKPARDLAYKHIKTPHVHDMIKEKNIFLKDHFQTATHFAIIP